MDRKEEKPISAGESQATHMESISKLSLFGRLKERFRERFSIENAIIGTGIAGVGILIGAEASLTIPVATEALKTYLPSVAFGLLASGFLLGGILGRKHDWKIPLGNKLAGITS